MSIVVSGHHVLTGRVIAVPESRELDVFSSLLERRGAMVLRCPLVAIRDAPDPKPVLQWIVEFNQGSCDDLILLTGEGLRRLLSCIDQHQPALRSPFIERLAAVRKITRGPKPARVLRELGLATDIMAVAPTTQGVIESLKELDLKDRTVGVQLYGGVPNPALIDYLRSAGAKTSIVSPYVYADAIDDEQVHDLLKKMSDGAVDVIAFTSMAQVERLFTVGTHEELQAAFSKVQVAAVGPVVRDALSRRDIQVQCMPEDSYFMKPLTTAMMEAFGSSGDR
ncbi:MAG TPA: uroporphyrinogen-III synthase [Steroidobacteraceae bacterium]|nr:uroporphyrinogen-III synthase [Steroidobacteraceae bacterium]